MPIPAKKSLGQNFLKSKEALHALITAGGIQSEDIILEVGPGKGILTRELVKAAQKVIAIEKDHRLIQALISEFSQEIAAGKLKIIEGDILEFDPESLCQEGEEYKIIANIPYYITGTFLQKFLESTFQPERMVLMVQKEVAHRIVARDGKESILSISVKAYGTPTYIMTVKAKYFSPQPKVDSAIILIENISKEFFKDFSEADFFRIVKAGFAHKRKMLVNNLGEALKGVALRGDKRQSRDTTSRLSITAFVREILTQCGINEKARAEDLSLSQWRKIVIGLLGQPEFH